MRRSNSLADLASPRHISVFRYPGGKSRLAPVVAKWVSSLGPVRTFVEPFAGGASVGLAVAARHLASQVVLIEKDDDVSAVWKLVFHGSDKDLGRLIHLTGSAEISHRAVTELCEREPADLVEHAFTTIVKNRCRRAGIMTPNAGWIKAGENGQGLTSRWYPDTIIRRLHMLRSLQGRVIFRQGDALNLIGDYAGATMFIDPPYTAGGKNAGARLYTHHSLDHADLFAQVNRHAADAFLTYDDNSEVRQLAASYNWHTAPIELWSAHNQLSKELCIIKSHAAKTSMVAL